MTEWMFASILRGLLSNLMIVLLIFSLARPKYGKRVMFLVIAASVLFDVGVNIYFYLIGDLSAIAKFDFFKLLILWLLFRPLFLDSFMQWSFTFLTAMNIEIMIVILSYRLRVFFPYPMYTHTLIRLVLFLLVIWGFHRFLRPYYRQVVENWNIVFGLVAAIFFNFSYYIFSGGGMIQNMDHHVTPLLLLIVLMISAYTAIFFFLNKISSVYILREENLIASMQQKHLKNELLLYKDLIDNARQGRHDLHHHNMILSEYLAADDLPGARRYLAQFDESIAAAALPMFCENLTANVVLRLYSRRAKENAVRFDVFAQIPEELSLPDPEMGTLLGNLLENALEACSKCEGEGRFLTLKAQVKDHSLEIEMRNSLCETVIFDDDLPRSTKQGGGTGTLSIQHIVERHSGMLRFQQEGETFVTQILLPV